MDKLLLYLGAITGIALLGIVNFYITGSSNNLRDS